MSETDLEYAVQCIEEVGIFEIKASRWVGNSIELVGKVGKDHTNRWQAFVRTLLAGAKASKASKSIDFSKYFFTETVMRRGSDGRTRRVEELRWNWRIQISPKAARLVVTECSKIAQTESIRRSADRGEFVLMGREKLPRYNTPAMGPRGFDPSSR